MVGEIKHMILSVDKVWEDVFIVGVVDFRLPPRGRRGVGSRYSLSFAHREGGSVIEGGNCDNRVAQQSVALAIID